MAAPARGDKKITTTKVLETVKWFNVRNRYYFINRNDTEEYIFVYQIAVNKDNPRKYLHSVGGGETVECDVAAGEKGVEAANVTGLVAVYMQQTVTIMDAVHVAGVPHAITSRITRTVRVGKRMRDRSVLPKAGPNSTDPTTRDGSPLLQAETL